VGLHLHDGEEQAQFVEQGQGLGRGVRHLGATGSILHFDLGESFTDGYKCKNSRRLNLKVCAPELLYVKLYLKKKNQTVCMYVPSH
jgi:hypothetical protein